MEGGRPPSYGSNCTTLLLASCIQPELMTTMPNNVRQTVFPTNRDTRVLLLLPTKDGADT